MYNFEITKKEQKKIVDWKKNQEKKAPGSTTIGARWTYSFTPTSIGIALEITDNQTNETIDITDYDKW